MIDNEFRTNNSIDSDIMAVKEPASSEGYQLAQHWEVIDTITHTDGKKEERRYFNTVVNTCSNLIACLMKGQSGYGGLQYWAVGSGNPLMSNTNPDVPSITDTKLLAETYRKAIVPATDIVFLDTNNAVTATITNKIQVSVSFAENEANGELREFGIYGGIATATKDSGIMINRKIHPLIYKTSGMRLDRIIRISY